ncbi:MAG: PfkB family carbohydrate kinase, partial [Gemmatimonadales bacterium]
MRQAPPPLSRDRVMQLIQRMKDSRVVVVGDIMLDRYLIGETERLSPEAPVPVVTVRERHAALGGAANVAANVAALGGSCLLVGAVGDDSDGAAIRQELAVARLPDRHIIA